MNSRDVLTPRVVHLKYAGAVVLGAAMLVVMTLSVLSIDHPLRFFFLAGIFSLWRRNDRGKRSSEAAHEQAARESEARHRAILEAVVDGILTIDERGIIESVNPAAERIFGYSADELIGRNVSMLMPSPYRDEHDSVPANEPPTGPRIINGPGREMVGRRKDGSTFPLELAVSEFRLGDRRIFMGMVRDVSQRKQAEDALRSAKQVAEEANVAKSQFLTNVSHELRTPMNAILGMTELALDEDLSPEVRGYLDTVRTSAEALLGLLNDILDFSRMESGGFRLDKSLFSLRTAINDAMRALAVRAYQKGLELVCDVAENLPDRVVGDPLRVRQILLNLVGNAVKFTEQGEVVVRVRLESRSAAEAVVHFTIADTGIGITEEERQRIFAPFTQVDGSTTRHYGGTGIGLAIVRNLTDLMGGRLEVESEMGKGSTFSFTIRLAIPKQEDWLADSRALVEFQRLRGQRVLIVDDSATNRVILQQWFKNWQMEPDLVADGPSALEKLREAAAALRPYAVVILDALMPGMDGFMLAEKIQADTTISAPTLLMLSSADRQVFASRWKSLNLAAYLEKPISQGELLDTLLRTLSVSSGKSIGQADRAVAGHDAPNENPPRSLCILLAEDTVANQKLVQSILKKRGHVVEVASNGREAVNLVRHRDFDLALMDVQMPIMDGFQATAAIRALKDPGKSCLPIVAMTAHAMRGDRERCLRSGMDAYIAKPVDSRRLIAVVERLARRPEMSSGRWAPPELQFFDDARAPEVESTEGA